MRDSYDIIIVGTGVAGLYGALHLPSDLKILMITKEGLEDSDSYLAQGGISTLRNKEDYDCYFEDTLKAGRYENNRESVDIMIRESTNTIERLIALGVEFDKVDGELSYTREGAHRINRILHHQDITGKEITSKLIERVKEQSHIELVTYATMIDLITKENVCQGIVVSHQGHIHPIYSKKVILATGGIGGLFENSTNFKHLTGDSLAIALKHHIALQDIHYIQIHPTTLYSKTQGRRFLISEAVRGEGAHLLNHAGKRFVDELLPRDVVSVAIYDQMIKDESPYVWLSLMHLGEEKIKRRFPNIYERCMEEGYDLLKEPIPVTPAQHYFMGGIKVDKYSKTIMDNLYAVGETSCNGVHGRNRLASNSLLESLIFAKRAACRIVEEGLGVLDECVPIDVQNYQMDKLEEDYKALILEEIKKKDGDFYDKWCHNDYQCG